MSEADAPERSAAGAWVRCRPQDLRTHNRVPRYAQGHVGVVVEVRGSQPLPGDGLSSRGPATLMPVYAVRFAAAELWGAGDHSVTLDLWEHYLEEAASP